MIFLALNIFQQFWAFSVAWAESQDGAVYCSKALAEWEGGIMKANGASKYGRSISSSLGDTGG